MAVKAPILCLSIEVSREGGKATYVEIELVLELECLKPWFLLPLLGEYVAHLIFKLVGDPSNSSFSL